MTYDECRLALAVRSVGRVAVATPWGPYVVPVNHVVANEKIYFRTPSFTVLGTHTRHELTAFQVDDFDEHLQIGWSVLARGKTDLVNDERERSWFDGLAQPRPWASGRDTRLYALAWSELSGRKIIDEPR